MTLPLGRWAALTGYRADPPARLHEGTGGWLLVHEGDPRVLRLGEGAGRLLSGLAVSGALSGPVGLPADPKLARVLGEVAGRGFLRRDLEPVEGALPSVAVVIPAFRRAEMVARCVASVAAQHYPAGLLEIVVVDDASADDGETAEAATGAGARVVTQARNGGPGAAREAGIRGTRSELVAFLDTDCVASSEWLISLVLQLSDPAVSAAACRVVTESGADTVSAFESVRSPLDMGAVFGDLDPRGPRFFHPTADMVVRRSALERAGGFATELRVGEDVDLCLRLLDEGGRFRYLPDGLVTHEPPSRAGQIANRRYAYGRSESLLWTRHPVTRSGIAMSAPRLVGAASLAAALARRSPRLALLGICALLLPTARRVAEDRAAVIDRLREPGFVLGRITSMLTNLSRYHAVTLLAVETALRRSVPVVAPACIVGSALCDYATLRPPLRAAAYVRLHVLEDLAYSSGVAAGALRPAFLRTAAGALPGALGTRTVRLARLVRRRLAA